MAWNCRRGLTRATRRSSRGSVTSRCTDSAASTVKKKAISGAKAANPVVATTFATSANTPTGANSMTQSVIFIITENMPRQKSRSTCACTPSIRVMKKPNSRLKKIIPSICPSAAAATMLGGIMRRNIPTTSPAPCP